MKINSKSDIQAMRDTFGEAIRHYNKRATETEGLESENFLNISTFMKMKTQHTMYVQKEGRSIYGNLKKNAKLNPDAPALNDVSLDGFTNKEAYDLATKYYDQYMRALLWHDLGRTVDFDAQAQPTYKNHPDESKIIADKYTNDNLVKLTILNHGYPTNEKMYEIAKNAPEFQDLSSEEQKACLVLSLLVRDADKLGNWKTFVNQGVTRQVTKRIKPETFRDDVNIHEYEMGCVKQNTTIDYSKYANFSGIQVAHIMWSKDIAFTSTKDSAISGNYVSGMINYMDEVAQDDTAKKVFEGKKSALPQYQRFLLQAETVFKTLQERGFVSQEEHFDKDSRAVSMKERLKEKNYDQPKVLTTGLQRYPDKKMPITSKKGNSR